MIKMLITKPTTTMIIVIITMIITMTIFFSWAGWSKKWSCVVTETCKLNSNSGGQSTVFKSNINSYKIFLKKFISSICQLEARQCKSAAINQT